MWPLTRRPSLRHAAIMVMLIGCAGLAAAAQLHLGHRILEHRVVAATDSADISVMDETTGSLGNIPGNIAARRAAPELSDEDRFHIYEGVMRTPDAPTVDEPPAEVAEALPGEVLLQDMPMSVTRKLPQVRDLKFVKFDDRILVVNPASRVVVAMIPRYKLIQ
jgi:hypothetical protein